MVHERPFFFFCEVLDLVAVCRSFYTHRLIFGSYHLLKLTENNFRFFSSFECGINCAVRLVNCQCAMRPASSEPHSCIPVICECDVFCCVKRDKRACLVQEPAVSRYGKTLCGKPLQHRERLASSSLVFASSPAIGHCTRTVNVFSNTEGHTLVCTLVRTVAHWCAHSAHCCATNPSTSAVLVWVRLDKRCVCECVRA